MNTIRKNLYLFWQGTIISYRALFAWLRPVTYVASKVLMPLAQMFFFTFLGSYATNGKNIDFYVIGNAIQIASVRGIGPDQRPGHPLLLPRSGRGGGDPSALEAQAVPSAARRPARRSRR